MPIEGVIPRGWVRVETYAKVEGPILPQPIPPAAQVGGKFLWFLVGFGFQTLEVVIKNMVRCYV